MNCIISVKIFLGGNYLGKAFLIIFEGTARKLLFTNVALTNISTMFLSCVADYKATCPVVS